MGLLNYNPYGGNGGGGYISDNYGTPSEDFDLGQIDGLLGSKSTAGQIGSIADKFAGTGGLIGNSVDAANQYANTGDISSMVPAGLRQAAATISSYTGMPLGQVFGLGQKVGRNVNQGMTPEDSMLGALLDFGIDMSLAGLGSIFGPLGMLAGGLVGSAFDVSSMAKGVTQDLNDWGFENQVEANVAARKGLQKTGANDLLGIPDIEDFQTLEDVMKYIHTTSTDQGNLAATDLGDLYGEHGWGEGGFGGMSMNDTDTQSGAGGGLTGGGFAGYGTDADAADNAPGEGGSGGNSGSGDGRGQGGDRGGGRDNDNGGYR